MCLSEGRVLFHELKAKKRVKKGWEREETGVSTKYVIDTAIPTSVTTEVDHQVCQCPSQLAAPGRAETSNSSTHPGADHGFPFMDFGEGTQSP